MCESSVARCQSQHKCLTWRMNSIFKVYCTGLAAVNQIYVFHEATNGFKKSKDSLKACFENVNILIMKLYGWIDRNQICCEQPINYRKMGNFRVVQFSRYFTVSREPRKLKSAEYFPSLTNCLFAFIKKK